MSRWPHSNETWASTPASLISTSCGSNPERPFLRFDALSALPFLRHAFTLRLPHVASDAPLTHGKIVRYHEDVLNALGTTRTSLVTANQIHGSQIVVVRTRPRLPIPDTDGLLTKVAGLPLGVYVADCCAVFLVDRKTPAIGLLHSGKKGTQENIAGEAIASMQRAFKTDPGNVLAVLSPCVGPCHYEMDISTRIEEQLRAAGVRDIVNPRLCTACDLDRFYSYRAEKGQTGRMLATMMLI
jgi:hypothetical protein